MNNRLTSRYPMLVLGLLTLLSPAAMAQLEEVTVTAERREASVQDVPVAVSAYSDKEIQALQINDTLDLVEVVPNLFGGNNTGLGTANMYYLRAQGNDESIATFDPPVGTYVDDVYITRQNANNFTFFDVDRIEVLRGPQGTLFGRNTTGGAINVILKKPGTEFGGYAEVGMGRWSAFQARASVDMPLSDSFLTKFSFFTDSNDGWLVNTLDGNSYNDLENRGFRGAVRMLLSDSVTWDLSVDYIDTDAANVRGEAVTASSRISSSILPGGVPAGGLYLLTFAPVPFIAKAGDYGNETETMSVVSNLGWDMLGGRANLIVGYRDMEQEFLLNFPNPASDDFFWIDNVGQHDTLTAELKWNGSLMDDRVDLVAGLYYMDEDNKTDFADYLFGGAFLLADRVIYNSTRSWAAYAQADIAVGDRGTLTIGARYTDEEKTIGLTDATPLNLLTTENLAFFGVPTKLTESKVTPRFAYSHDFNDEVMAYVSATNGFKSGGWNARGVVPTDFQPFGPEEIWSYELGLRADWLNDTLRTNITAFYSDLDDLQTTSATPTGQFLTTNAGGLEVSGVELELTWLPTDNWTVFAAVGLQNPKYVDLPEGCVVPNTDFAAFDADCNVADPKRSPEETVTLGTSLDINLGFATLRPFASMRYIGSNVVGTRNLGVNGSTTLWNGGLALVSNRGGWEAVVECRNCSNEIYTTSFLFVPYYNAPGAWQARVRFNF